MRVTRRLTALSLACALGTVTACSASTTAAAPGLGGSSARKGNAADAGGCALIDLAVAASVLKGSVADRSAQPDVCLFSDAGGARRLEVVKVPRTALQTELADSKAVRAVSGVGEQAYWSRTDQILFVIRGDSAYSINVSAGDASQRASERGAVAVAHAVLGA